MLMNGRPRRRLPSLDRCFVRATTSKQLSHTTSHQIITSPGISNFQARSSPLLSPPHPLCIRLLYILIFISRARSLYYIALMSARTILSRALFTSSARSLTPLAIRPLTNTTSATFATRTTTLSHHITNKRNFSATMSTSTGVHNLTT